MSSGTWRGVVTGTVLGGLVAAAALYGLSLLEMPTATGPDDTSRYVVILEAPDEDGLPVAGLALLVDAARSSVSVLDPFAESTVSGTSARNAREALPFGGGAAVVVALGPQIGTGSIPWVVVPGDAWAEMIDACGPIEVSVPRSFSSYVGGELTVFGAGVNVLSGSEVVAMAGAIAELPESDRTDLHKQLAAGVGACVRREERLVIEYVSTGVAVSSVPPQTLVGGASGR